jgi:hypothetical protein
MAAAASVAAGTIDRGVFADCLMLGYTFVNGLMLDQGI